MTPLDDARQHRESNAPEPIEGWVAVYPTAGCRGLYPTREACMKIEQNALGGGKERAVRAVFVRESAP